MVALTSAQSIPPIKNAIVTVHFVASLCVTFDLMVVHVHSLLPSHTLESNVLALTEFAHHTVSFEVPFSLLTLVFLSALCSFRALLPHFH